MTVFLTVSCLLSFGLLELLVVYGDGSSITYLAGLKLSELTMFYLFPYQFFVEFPRGASSDLSYFLFTCDSCNMDTSNLPDMYAQSPRAAGAKGIHIRQITSAHVATNM